MNIKRYSWTFDKRDNIWTSSTHDTIEECVEEAKKLAGMDIDNQVIYVGENVLYEPYVDAMEVLELVENAAHDQCGEVADDWHSYDGSRMKAELAELSSKLTLVIKDWLKKNNREPFIYAIMNIKKVSLLEDLKDQPEICDTCSTKEVCGLQEQCCSEDGKNCACYFPESKEFLRDIEEGDIIFVLYEETAQGDVCYATRIAMFAGTAFDASNGDIKVCINYTTGPGEKVTCEWVDAKQIFKTQDDLTDYLIKQGYTIPPLHFL